MPLGITGGVCKWGAEVQLLPRERCPHPPINLQSDSCDDQLLPLNLR
jgi:uncharacterized membrane protein YagU involved in acid resistance